jgi:hypothetical protein
MSPLENAFGELALDATLLARFGEHATIAKRITGVGDQTLVTPNSGKRIRLYWLGMSTSETNSGEVLAIVKLATAYDPSGGPHERYRWEMGAPGAFSHWQTITGVADAPLVVNLNVAGRPVEVNYTYEEIT